MIKYKLTDQRYQTYGETQWGVNVTHTASGEEELCTGGWIHVYDSPELAALLNPIHADFSDPVLWKCEVSGKSKHDHGLKSGYTSVTTLRQIPLPVISVEQRIKFAILCALEVCRDRAFRAWAKRWLNGTDRTEAAARAAGGAAGAAADAALAAADAAWDATNAAWDAADAAAKAMNAANAARAAANAAWAAADAAWDATNAARAAAWAARTKGKLTPLKLLQIAERAIQ